jgi:hypothetical protein
MAETEKKSINWEKYTALSSMLVAVCALVISIWQSYSIQQHNKLSLRPYLQPVFNFNANGSWDLHIFNQGTGPAQVIDVQYKVDDQTYHDRDAFLIALGEEPDCYSKGHIERFYKVEDQQVVFATRNTGCFKAGPELRLMLNRIQIVLNYQSLYGETFQLLIGES